MKPSYKISLILSAAVLILALFIYSSNEAADTTEPTAENSAQQPEAPERPTLRSDPDDNTGSLAEIASNKASAPKAQDKPAASTSRADDIRARIQAAMADKPAPNPQAQTDTQPEPAATEENTPDTAAANTTAPSPGIPLARTDQPSVIPHQPLPRHPPSSPSKAPPTHR